MERIRETLEGVMRSLEAKKKGAPGQDPEANLKKLLTKKERGHIKFDYFNKGVVNINVDSSSWLFHLNLRREKLAEQLHKKVPAAKGIRFRLGVIKSEEKD